MLRGIVLVVAMLWLSNVLNLHVLSYILSKTVELGFLALIIVFQPEIRHFLEQVGSGQFRLSSHSLSLPGTELETAIDETVEAYSAMSKDKIGALMVFERNSILDTCLNSGTVLDAAVSSELLKNIFWPKAPMHDGAVVVRNGRVAGAGCMLPLSGNHKDQPGTGHAAPCRHRGNGTYGCCGRHLFGRDRFDLCSSQRRFETTSGAGNPVPSSEK